jgi:hypothetical protein
MLNIYMSYVWFSKKKSLLLNLIKLFFFFADVVTVVASIVVLSGPGGQMFAASALRGLRFFQVRIESQNISSL